MLFNSLEFLLFFPLTTILYFLFPHKYRWLLLLVASCIFYMAFIPAYILILFFTIVIDYIAGIVIENATLKKRKTFLIISILANVLVLAIFKYYNFFIENVNELFHSFGISTQSLPLLNIILPIGLSFHTFQAMSYTIEVYRGNQRAERHFGIYSLYVMFYPQLVAGPIERPQNLLHQFKEKHFYSSRHLLDGLRLMLWGFFKKLVIADRLSQYVDIVYNSPGDFHYLNLIIATLFFAVQIYCDFSGYSDIAIGAAKTMGFDLMTNFNRPYFSKNIQEFWKRWHISLSTWFKDYLYIFLGGNRHGIKRMYLNVSIVFLVSGFWHGANWTYIMWGALHTLFIITYMLYHQYSKIKFPKNILSNALGIFTTFLLVSFAWIFFRAGSISDAFLVVKNIITLNDNTIFASVLTDKHTLSEFGITSIVIGVIMAIIMFLIEIKLPPGLQTLDKKPLLNVAFCTFTFSLIILLGVFAKESFIYFQF
ncbi:MAG: MBOAT family protein [Rhizobacter sp.]|nr:MBOAT family protein [Ferruginibacter sp.]